MNASFILVKKDGQRKAFAVNTGVVVIGRRPECDLRIPLMEVSRKHCRLEHQGDVFTIRDMGSSNGTFVNGIRIEETQLKSGDNVQIGPLTFIFESGSNDTSSPDAPVQAKPEQISDEDFFENIGPLGDIKSSSATDLPQV